jgi:hypothetical protein
MNRRALTVANRIDAVAGAVAHFQPAMMMDVDQAAKAMRDEEMLAEIEDFLRDFNQPTYRGMPINGVRVATWSIPGWSGDSRPEADWVEFWVALSPKRGLEGDKRTGSHHERRPAFWTCYSFRKLSFPVAMS